MAGPLKAVETETRAFISQQVRFSGGFLQRAVFEPKPDTENKFLLRRRREGLWE